MINNKNHEALSRKIITELCRGTMRLFKYNSSSGYTGDAIRGPLNNVSLGPRDIIIRNARRFTGGLVMQNGKSVTGIPDNVGIEKVTITPEMVGQTITELVLIEIKTGKGKLSPNQKKFHNFANHFGIRIGVARSVDDAKSI